MGENTALKEWFQSKLADKEVCLIQISESDYFAGIIPEEFSVFIEEAGAVWINPPSELAAAFFEAAISLKMLRIISQHPWFNFKTPVWVTVLAIDPLSGRTYSLEVAGMITRVCGGDYTITLGNSKDTIVIPLAELDQRLRPRF